MKTIVCPSSCATSFSTRLQPLLELAAVLRAGEQQRHVEDEDALVLQRIGHLAGDDALRQAFDDRRLADARLADQHRVVLGAPLQHLDRAPDLVVAADHRVELAVAGALGQVDRVLLQRLALAFGLGAVDLLAAAHRLDRRLERLALVSRTPCSSAPIAERLRSAAASRNISLEMNWSPRLLASFSAACSSAPSSRPGWTCSPPWTCGSRSIASSSAACSCADVDAGAREQRLRSVGLREHRGEHVDRLDVRVVARDRQALRIAQRLLELGRQLVDSHGEIPPDRGRGWAPARRFQGAPAAPGLDSAQEDGLGQAKAERGAGQRADHVGQRVAEREQELRRAAAGSATRPRTPRRS